jgi:2-deoxy-D-gluconate 3-dehydrogenase
MSETALTSMARLFDLTGKCAIVTGGAAGIGRGIAGRLAEAGASVLIADVNAPQAEAAAAALREQGYRAQAVGADVRAPADVRRLLEAAVQEFGGVDILVNNAGIFPATPVLQMPEEEWDRVLDINLKGAILCSQAVAQQMVAQGRGGVIVNIASIDSIHPSAAGLAHYDASKGGMLMLTKSLALELAPNGIRVVAIAPGGIMTEGVQARTEAMRRQGIDADQVMQSFVARIPLRRMGAPDDIARVALFLASDAAAYVTGTLVVVDGGVLLT